MKSVVTTSRDVKTSSAPVGAFPGAMPVQSPIVLSPDFTRQCWQVWGAWIRLLLFLLMPTVAQAQFSVITNNGAITITGYTGPGGAVTIPSTINGRPVTGIADSAFNAFLGNTSPASITIPDSVTNIGSGVFNECLSLTTVTIGKGVISIGIGNFVYCLSLKAITVDALNPAYSSVDGVLFNKTQSTLIQYPAGKKTGVYAIPNSVTNIASLAFYQCESLTNVDIPNSVTVISQNAFDYCTSLNGAIIPNIVTIIGVGAFHDCFSLKTISIPNSVTSIGRGAFEASGLTSVTIPSSVSSIENQTFDLCESLTNVTISDGVTSIEDLAFYSCSSLTSITIPDSVTNLGSTVFGQCFNLTAVYFQGNAPSADPTIFYNDGSATTYYLPLTTGWNSQFGGRPALLWNPSIQTTDAGFRIQTNLFGFNIKGTVNIPIAVKASTNLADASWTTLQTCTLTNGLIYFNDPQWTNYPTRFYRLGTP